MARKVRVFVSSTMTDLANERLAVIQRLSELRFEPVNAEGWGPDGGRSWPRIQREIEESDLFALILGERYGWVPETGPGAGSGLSVTHLEYKEAVELKIPILPFLKQLTYDSDRSSEDARKRDDFRREVRSWAEGQLVAEFALAPDLAGKLGQSLLELLAHSFLAQRITEATESKALSEKQQEILLANRRSETEREVLRVVWENRGKYLRRADVYDQLSLEKRPTPARVGQILAELHHVGLLTRIHGRAQGNPYASFYALSPRGIELCSGLGLISPMATEEATMQEHATLPKVPIREAEAALRSRIYDIGKVILDPRRSNIHRGLALGALATSSTPGKQVLETLAIAASERSGKEVRDLFKEAFKNIVIAKVEMEAGLVTPPMEKANATEKRQRGIYRLSNQSLPSKIISMADIETAHLRDDIRSAREEAILELLL